MKRGRGEVGSKDGRMLEGNRMEEVRGEHELEEHGVCGMSRIEGEA